MGYDTDTIASMAGALAGALRGFDATPMNLFREVEKVNRLDLEKHRPVVGKNRTPKPGGKTGWTLRRWAWEWRPWTWF